MVDDKFIKMQKRGSSLGHIVIYITFFFPVIFVYCGESETLRVAKFLCIKISGKFNSIMELAFSQK